MRTVYDMLDRKAEPHNTIDPDALVVEALHLMDDVNLSYVVVMRDEKFMGIFSERDYSRNVALKGRSSATCPVKDAMTKDLPVVSPTDTVENCIQKILEHKTRYLPVFEESDFKGVITMHDIMRQVLSDKQLVFDEEMIEYFFDDGGKIF
jgi:CBS domain-containing protein